MAKNRTATVIFKGDDQISPAIKGATNSVAGLGKSFNAVDEAAKKVASTTKTASVSLNDFLNGSTEQARDLTGQLQNLSSIVADVGRNFTQVAEASSQAFLAFDTAKTKVATLSNESNLYANQALKLTGDNSAISIGATI